MTILFYAIAAVIGVLCSTVAAMLSAFGGVQFMFVMVALLVFSHVVTMIFAVSKAKQKNIGLAVVALVSPAFIATFIVYAGVTLFAIAQSAYVQYMPDPKFSTACEGTGVHIFNVPSKKVNSIYADWDDGGHVGPRTKYFVDSSGRLTKSFGGMPLMDGISNSPLADVIVTEDISNLEETRKALVSQGLLRYTLTATDRRDGRKLATMAFAVDIANGRACGSNVEDGIDVVAFFRQVTGAPKPTDAKLEIVSEEDFQPEKLIKMDDAYHASNQAIFEARENTCKAMLKPAYPRSLFMNFVKDTSGRMVASTAMMICHPDAILVGDYLPDASDFKHVVLNKYSLSGDLIYKVRFERPTEPVYYRGTLDVTTVKSERGYLSFDWQSSYDDAPPGSVDRVLHINRRMKVRIKEPE
jgi:hypothetical protein